jgi:hypothetical protein
MEWLTLSRKTNSPLRRALALILCVLSASLCASRPPPFCALRYVVIITRHGVRSPTWKADLLSQYSTAP